MSNLHLKQELDAKQIAIAQSEFANQKKSVAIAYLLWFFLGGVGGHRFYIGKPVSGFAMLGLWVLGFLTAFIFIGYLFFFIVYAWAIVDAIFLAGKINRMNAKKERQIIESIAHQ